MINADVKQTHRVVIPDDDDALDLYTDRLMGFCADVATPRRIADPDASVHLRSRMCGSTVTIDVQLNAKRHVEAFGYEVKACSLGSAATAILAKHAVGSDAQTLAAVRDAVRTILSGADEIDIPEGWEDIAVLAPARDTRSRHSAIMIAFDAASEAVSKAGEKTT